MFAKHQDKLAKGRILIVHGGMGYFERSYGVTFIALEDLSGVATLSGKKMRDLEDQNIIGALSEFGRSPRGVEVAAQGLGIEVSGELHIGILGENMASWQDMIRHNQEAMRKLLEQAS